MSGVATIDRGGASRRRLRTVGLDFTAWPEGDRALWNAVFPDDIDDLNERFDGQPPTLRSVGNIRQLLCRVAGFHTRETPLLLDRPFIDRFEEDTLVLLVDDLADTCANETIRDYLKALAFYLRRCGAVAQRWFERILRDLARNTPSERREGFPVSSREIAERAAGYMTKALIDLPTHSERTRSYNAPERFRNGFIVLLLIKRPLRLLNLSQLSIGKTFFCPSGTFEVRFPGDMMKNGDPYSSVFGEDDPELLDWTRRYLHQVLPCFNDGNALFRSRQGGALTPIGLYQIITEITQELVGVRLTPHDFRRVFTDSAIKNGKKLSDINHASQRRPESETIYDYKTAVSSNARQVVRPMLDAKLSAVLSQRMLPKSL